MAFASRITGTGSSFPAQIVTNEVLADKLSRMGVATDDQWIRERTGIRQRRYADLLEDRKPNVALATVAASEALEMAGKTARNLDQIIVATCTPDTLLPSTACWLQNNIGATNAWAMDINAACSGFIYGVATASQFIAGGQSQTVLVVGSEVIHPHVDWNDRGSCILFGDGAGAVIIEQVPEQNRSRILSWQLSSDGKFGDLLYIPTYDVDARGNVDKGGSDTCMVMNGREIFKVAVRTLAGIARKTLAKIGLTVDDVDWFIPHQANQRILEAVAQRLNMPWEKVLVNVDRYGNTSAATIPTIMDEAVRDERIQKGQLLLLDAFGAGFTYGAMLVRW